MRWTFIVVAVTLILAACTRAVGTSDGPREGGPSLAAVETAEPTPEQTPDPTLEPLPSDQELRHTVELRRAMGLRSDLEWIAAVAADPRASTYLLAIPLLSEEEEAVIARSDEADAIGSVINEYVASHRDEFGGLYIDHESGAGVVTLWTGHLSEHEAAIRSRLEPGARVVFKAVRFSERYLLDLQNRITVDLDWMAAIPAQWQSVSVDVIQNHALLTVSSANPEAVTLIERHFNLGEALAVESDGTGVALVPWGDVAGRVRTETGAVPPPGGGYYLRWRGSAGLECGGGDVGYGLAEDGTFHLPCQVGTWTIEVTVPSGDGWRPIGEGTVEVSANRTANLGIVLTDAP